MDAHEPNPLGDHGASSSAAWSSTVRVRRWSENIADPSGCVSVESPKGCHGHGVSVIENLFTRNVKTSAHAFQILFRATLETSPSFDLSPFDTFSFQTTFGQVFPQVFALLCNLVTFDSSGAIGRTQHAYLT